MTIAAERLRLLIETHAPTFLEGLESGRIAVHVSVDDCRSPAARARAEAAAYEELVAQTTDTLIALAPFVWKESNATLLVSIESFGFQVAVSISELCRRVRRHSARKERSRVSGPSFVTRYVRRVRKRYVRKVGSFKNLRSNTDVAVWRLDLVPWLQTLSASTRSHAHARRLLKKYGTWLDLPTLGKPKPLLEIRRALATSAASPQSIGKDAIRRLRVREEVVGMLARQGVVVGRFINEHGNVDGNSCLGCKGHAMAAWLAPPRVSKRGRPPDRDPMAYCSICRAEFYAEKGRESDRKYRQGVWSAPDGNSNGQLA